MQDADWDQFDGEQRMVQEEDSRTKYHGESGAGQESAM